MPAAPSNRRGLDPDEFRGFALADPIAPPVFINVPNQKIERWCNRVAAEVLAPVYRREVGLWEHQKHFVKLAFGAHRGPHGARFVLADQVGLGKTLQLTVAAQLMALAGDRPVLAPAPVHRRISARAAWSRLTRTSRKGPFNGTRSSVVRPATGTTSDSSSPDR